MSDRLLGPGTGKIPLVCRAGLELVRQRRPVLFAPTFQLSIDLPVTEKKGAGEGVAPMRGFESLKLLWVQE